MDLELSLTKQRGVSGAEKQGLVFGFNIVDDELQDNKGPMAETRTWT